MKNLYIASCEKDGGIVRYSLNNNNEFEFVKKYSCDKPMYMIENHNKMYVLLKEVFNDKSSGVFYYNIKNNGELCNSSEILSTKGKVACHLFCNENSLYVVNYTSGSVIKMPNKLVIHSENNKESHTHFVGITPDNKYICVTDLGLDYIYFYTKDLEFVNKVKTPDTHGVRHLIFSDNGRYAFSANECKSTVSAYSYNNGNMTLIDTISTLPKDFKGTSYVSAIRIYKDNIYISNRGHNSIAKVSFSKNKLKLLENIDCMGKTPRDFIIKDGFLIIGNLDSNTVNIFDNNYNLKQTININKPICVLCDF